MNTQILLEIDRCRDAVLEAATKFTQDDWDDVLVLAYKLTAEQKVARANDVAGYWANIAKLWKSRYSL